jgi:hypothetical protein
MGFYFNGRYYIKPTVSTYVDDSALQPVGLVGSNVIGIVGPSKDGVPNQAYLLTSLNDAIDIFSEGPLVEGVARAFSSGAQFIWAVRTAGTYNYATKSFSSEASRSSYLYNASPAAPFSLYSTFYGAHANGISVTFSNNSTKGVDIVIEGFGNTYEAIGIYRNVLNIKSLSDSVTFSIANSSSYYYLTITNGFDTAPSII